MSKTTTNFINHIHAIDVIRRILLTEPRLDMLNQFRKQTINS